MQQHDEQIREPVANSAATILTVPEAYAELRVSRSKLYGLIRSNKLNTIRIGRRRLIPREAIHELVQQLRTKENF
jgi:excisionase family DNA binding protein